MLKSHRRSFWDHMSLQTSSEAYESTLLLFFPFLFFSFHLSSSILLLLLLVARGGSVSGVGGVGVGIGSDPDLKTLRHWGSWHVQACGLTGWFARELSCANASWLWVMLGTWNSHISIHFDLCRWYVDSACGDPPRKASVLVITRAGCGTYRHQHVDVPHENWKPSSFLHIRFSFLQSGSDCAGGTAQPVSSQEANSSSTPKRRAQDLKEKAEEKEESQMKTKSNQRENKWAKSHEAPTWLQRLSKLKQLPEAFCTNGSHWNLIAELSLTYISSLSSHPFVFPENIGLPFCLEGYTKYSDIRHPPKSTMQKPRDACSFLFCWEMLDAH